MTWHFHASVSDTIYRLVDEDARTVWGVDHGGFDANSSDALGEAEVELPTGTNSLLLVEPMPGGLVLDAVRSYQGLTDGELCTLFLGIFAELPGRADAEARLCLDSIGLDADGRPRIIPGITRTPVASARRAIGEMLYHAAHGRPWEESLLPVNLALPDVSQPLRTVIAEMLDDSADGSSLPTAIAEASAALRLSGVPSALPLLPAERDIDPGQALTARLRAVSAHPAADTPPSSAQAPAGPVLTHHKPAGSLAAALSEKVTDERGHGGGIAGRLRAVSRGKTPRKSRKRHGRRAARLGLRSVWPTRRRQSDGARPGEAGWRRFRIPMVAALFLMIIGAAVMIRLAGADASSARPDQNSDTTAASARADGADGAEQVDETAERTAERTADPSAGVDATGRSDNEIVAHLQDLCAERAEALSAGDADGLRALTVPDSTAALADELIDLHAYAGSDYAIELDDLEITKRTAGRIVITATMSTSADTGGQRAGFESKRLEFQLAQDAGEWKIAEVRDLAG
ncbi:hypothetical protein [Brevibacterium sp. ZH18]|uniref:hypothetical protein n=1 Tax=Brevibacterium sp. ZH18 TaxID=2927784 RepID=UPI001F621E49|nr:hypothetical protein [Brevibacterium sp. ZH18]MCI4012626.1 hypothetical protein [Brevibacterium sp. ZH18]